MLNQFTETFLSAPVFVARAYAALESLDGDQYRMRSVPGSKQLIEEILPLAALLKHLEVPDRHILCQFVGETAEHDAQIQVSGLETGFLKAFYYVEVTVAVSSNDYLKREALTRNGYVYGGDEIERTGTGASKQVVSRAVALDGEVAVDNIIKWATECVLTKSAKPYPQPCILVVGVHPERRFSLLEWSRVVAAVGTHVDRSRFEIAFLADWQTNIVLGI